MLRPSVCIVTPALADANNGNWRTASRWARMLGAVYRVRLASDWHGEADDALIALHARRSAPSIARWAEERPRCPVIVALTGTDLYRDIRVDAEAQHALARATRLVVLHERAPDDLPEAHRHQAVVCFQSTPARATIAKPQRHLRALLVGHLRDEKRPQTYFDAARALAHRADILLDHVGGALDAQLGRDAQALQAACPRYRWLGALPHEATRRRIQRAHLLVNTSRMEGGAHVVMEAVRSGTPVIASRIPGNVGMLGAGYGGYFEAGDAPGLAALLVRCRDEPPVLAALAAQCAERSPLFEPARERATLLALMRDVLETSPCHP